MDTALPQKIPFIIDRTLAKANCTENHVCTSYLILYPSPTLMYLYTKARVGHVIHLYTYKHTKRITN